MVDITTLYEGCKKGSPRYQRELYELYKSRLMGLCRRYTRNREEAEDVLQDAFIKIFTKFHQAGSSEKLEGWMKSVTVRTAIDHYHKQEKNRKMYENDDASVLNTAGTHIDSLSDEYLVTRINQLPGKCRMVFNLFEIEGYSHHEIGAMMTITESTSRSQLHYAKTLLKEKLKGDESPNYYEKFARG
jgi:RNA polymerase sigma-70 factor (ECF subfamily)